jgi:hypothetical protein
MAQLNDYITADGTNLGVPNKPTDRHSPNGLARITPKYSRGDASQDFADWQAANIGVCEVTSFSAIKDGDAGWTGGTYMLFSDGATDGYIWFMHDGVGADPAPNANDFGHINVSAGESSASITNKLHLIFRNLANTTVQMVGNNVINVRNDVLAVTTDATAGTLTDSVITVTILEQGAAPDPTAYDGTYTDIDGPQNLVYNDE